MQPTFFLRAVIKPEHVGMVESYLAEKEWFDCFPAVKPWHDYLGQKGHYHLIDAYMYFMDYPIEGYTREEFSGGDRTLILTSPVDCGVDVPTMVELLIKPISENVEFFIQGGGS